MVNMERKYYTGLIILVLILIVVFGIKMTTRIEYTNVNESGEVEVDRVYLNDTNETIYENINKKDKNNNESVASINQETTKLKKINNKLYDTNETEVNIKKKIKDETFYK